MNRWFLWLPALAIAAALVAFGGPVAPSDDGVVAAVPRAAASEVAGPASRGGRGPASLATPGDRELSRPADRQRLYPLDASIAYRDLFDAAPASAPGPASAPAPDRAASAAAPTSAFTVVGRRFDGRTWEVFLMQDDRALVAKAGDTLPGEIRVEQVDATQMVLLDLATHTRQRIVLDDTK